MKAGWRDGPLGLRDLAVSNMHNILTANICNDIENNSVFCSFASFLFVSLIHFINNPGSSSDLIIFIISFTFSFEIINASVREATFKRWLDRFFLFFFC